MFIAASGSLKSLAIAETGHRCPSLASFERGLDVLLRKGPGSVAGHHSASDARLAPVPKGKVDRVMRELSRKEQELDQWIRSSDANATWFHKDPVAAIRAANLGISEEALKELESVTAVIALKLKAWL